MSLFDPTLHKAMATGPDTYTYISVDDESMVPVVGGVFCI